MAPQMECGRQPELADIGYISDPPPFVNQLIEHGRTTPISPEEVRHIITEADQFQTVANLDTMNRQIDLTGFVPEFIGRCQTADQVLDELIRLGSQVKSAIHQEPEQLQKEIFDALQGAKCTPEALLWLDEQHGSIMKSLKEQRTPEAEDFRQRNIDALEKQKVSDIFYEPVFYQSSSLVPQEKRLTAINRHTHVPQLPGRNRDILENLTPMQCKRELEAYYKGIIDTESPIGIMLELRKAGTPLARALAQHLRERRSLEEQFEVAGSTRTLEKEQGPTEHHTWLPHPSDK